MKSINVFLASVIPAISFATAAQQLPALVTPPAHKCEKPVGGPGVDPTYEQQKRSQKKVDSYKKCINKYAAEMKTQADEHFEITKRFQDAANAAIDEYNAYANDLNAQHGNKDKDGKASSVRPVAPTPSDQGKKYVSPM